MGLAALWQRCKWHTKWDSGDLALCHKSCEQCNNDRFVENRFLKIPKKLWVCRRHWVKQKQGQELTKSWRRAPRHWCNNTQNLSAESTCSSPSMNLYSNWGLPWQGCFYLCTQANSDRWSETHPLKSKKCSNILMQDKQALSRITFRHRVLFVNCNRSLSCIVMMQSRQWVLSDNIWDMLFGQEKRSETIAPKNSRTNTSTCCTRHCSFHLRHCRRACKWLRKCLCPLRLICISTLFDSCL